MDRPLLIAAANECQKGKAYDKLILKAQGLYRVIDISWQKIIIDEDRMLSTISVDQAASVRYSIKDRDVNNRKQTNMFIYDDPLTYPSQDHFKR